MVKSFIGERGVFEAGDAFVNGEPVELSIP
jgi:hypothetical protein